MNTKGVFVRLFMGFPLTSAFRSQLLHSPTWKNAQLNPLFDLVLIQHEGQEYVGLVLDGDKIPLSDLQKKEIEIKSTLLKQCPQLNLDELSTAIFPQQYVM